MARVVGWASDNAGTGYYRVALPLLELQQLGHETAATNYVSRKALERWRPDVIVAQRIASPEVVETWEDYRRTDFCKLVLDIDDDLFNIDPDNRAHDLFKLPSTQDAVLRAIRAAHVVTVSTPQLAERIKPFAESIEILPNRIDPALPGLGADRLAARQEPASPGRVRIGWAGSPTHAGDIAEAARQISRYLWAHAHETELAFFGKDYSEYFSLPFGYRVHLFPWIRDLDRYYIGLAAAHFDIGIAPLKNNIFNRSKSPVKVLEYAALGIPAVASEVAPYRDFIRHGQDGMLVSRPGDWKQVLRHLVSDASRRYDLATAAHEKARQWTIDKHIKDWADVYGI